MVTSDLEALAFAYGEEKIGSIDEPPPPRGDPKEDTGWMPDLNPTQWKIFNDEAKYILAYGEKGSGKTIGVGHKAVRHAYENDNALVIVLMATQRAGSLGIWGDIDRFVLPAWKAGIDLEFTDSKLDANTKDRYRWIKNRHGGWSQMLLMSVLYAAQVEQRIKGPTPSMVVVDELTECEGVEYWSFPSMQLGRRVGIEGPQQYVATCNPKGPEHWVYQLFWVDYVDQETGARDPDFSVHHVPFMENAHRLPQDYLAAIEKICKKDPIQKERLIEGKWVARPTGEGLFAMFYVPALHLKGNAARGEGLLALAGFPLIIGYDLGQVYSSVTFEQLIPTKSGRNLWRWFDEIDYLGKRILYRNLALEIVDRIKFWSKRASYPFAAIHVSDDSAVNQWRPGGEGSYDAWEFEKEFNKLALERGEQPVKMKGCPKGSGSVAARVRLVTSKLASQELFVSATCRNAHHMLSTLEADGNDPDGERPKRCPAIHKLDSGTYPMFYLEMRPGRNSLQTGQRMPSIIRCGMTSK